MIEGKQNILAWFSMKELPYWSLFHQGKTDSGNWVAKSSGSETATFQSAYDELDKNLSLINRGKFMLVVSATPNAISKGTHRTEIEITYNNALPLQSAPMVGSVPEGYVSKSEISGIVENHLNQYKTEQQLKELQAKVVLLEKENKELEKSSNEGWNTFIGALQPFLPRLLGKIVPQVAGIPEPHTHEPLINHTMPEQQTQDLTPDQAERLQNAINAFYEAAPNEWLEILEKMAAKVRTNPAILSQLKMFL